MSRPIVNMLKQIIKYILAFILTLEAQLVLKKYRPKIVAVTGNVGKTTTKEAIFLTMQSLGLVRRSEKSYNNELGVPLTILGRSTPGTNILGWLDVMISGISLLLFRQPYPAWLVLELGVDRPGDIKRVVKWLPVDVAVITHLPNLPVHLEFFRSAEHLHQEKMYLAEAAQLTSVLNYDDSAIMAAASRAKGKLVTYGFNEGANVRANYEQFVYQEGEKGRVPAGLSFKVEYGGTNMPVRLPHLIARHQIYAGLAAIAVAVSQGVSLITAAEALEVLETPPGRMKLLRGIKDTLIIDDTYNSSPMAVTSALATLKALEVPGKKIVVLGDMMELGLETVEAHRQAGREVKGVANDLITVGMRAKFIAETAKLRKGHWHHFDNSIEAGKFIQTMLKTGDVILVKGSQSMRMEWVVEEIMAEPERKAELLVRQSAEWRGK
jgi:UDP-N-acetylmuramyl pentapeptide synthase